MSSIALKRARSRAPPYSRRAERRTQVAIRPLTLAAYLGIDLTLGSL
jgi:hypothetical protein